MPRVAIPVTEITRAGVVPPAVTTGDSTNDHTIAGNDGRIFIEAENTGGGALSIDVETANTVDGLTISDLSVSVTNGAANKKLIGPFPPAIYNQPDGSLNVNVGANTWNLRAFRIP